LPYKVALMKTVRLVAAILFYVARVWAVIVLIVAGYASGVVVIHLIAPKANLPMSVLEDQTFRIYFPFTKKVFLLGDYTSSYLVTNLVMIIFYGIFLWLLSAVFHAFRQQKIFTRKGVIRLSRFYIINLLMPLLFVILLLAFGRELFDMIRIGVLHLVIGVFAFFMAAIFKQGLLLQEEQDLTF
jgi:hypothetical protein